MENDRDIWKYQQPGFRGLLLAELQRQQRGSQFCDIVLRAEGVSVPAHSCVLSALSPQLSCSLPSTPPPTGQRHLVEFGTVRASTLLRLVGLLYSGEITGHGEEEREDILSATTRLGISGLVEVRQSGEDSGRRAVGIQTDPLMLEEGGGRDRSDGSTLHVGATKCCIEKGTGSQVHMGNGTTDDTHLTLQAASGIPDPHHNIPYVPLPIFYPPDGTQALAQHPLYSDYTAPSEQSTSGGHEPVYYVPPPYSSLIPAPSHYPYHAPAVVYDHTTEALAPEGGGEGFEQFDGNIPGFINYFLNPDQAECSRGKRRARRRGGGARGARQTRSGEKRAPRTRGEPKRRGRPPKQMAAAAAATAAGEVKDAPKSIPPSIRLRSWGVQARRSGRGGGSVGRLLHLHTRDHLEPIKLWLKKWSRGKSMKISNVRDEPPMENEGAAAAQQLIQEGALAFDKQNSPPTATCHSKPLHLLNSPHTSNALLNAPIPSFLPPAPEMVHTTLLPSLEAACHVEQAEQLDRLLDEVMMGLDILDKNNNSKSTHDSHPHPHLDTETDGQQECHQRPVIPTDHQETVAGVHNNPTKTVTMETGVGGFTPSGSNVPVLQQQGEGPLGDILDKFLFSFEQQVSNCNPGVRVENNGQTCTSTNVSTSQSSTQSQPCTVDRDQSIAGQSLLAIHAQKPGTYTPLTISSKLPPVSPAKLPSSDEVTNDSQENIDGTLGRCFLEQSVARLKRDNACSDVQPVSAASAVFSSVSSMGVTSIAPKEPRPIRKPELKLLVKKKKQQVSNCSTEASVVNVVHRQNPGTLPQISSKLPTVSAAKRSSSDAVTNGSQKNKDRILAGRQRGDRKVCVEQPSVARLAQSIKRDNTSTLVSSVSTVRVPSIQPKDPKAVRKPELKLIINKTKKHVSYCSTGATAGNGGQPCTPATNSVSTSKSSSQSQPHTVIQPQNPITTPQISSKLPLINAAKLSSSHAVTNGSQENKDSVSARRHRRDRKVFTDQPSVAPLARPIKREKPKPPKVPARKPEVKLVVKKKRVWDDYMEGRAKLPHNLQPIVRVSPLFSGQCADLKGTVILPGKSPMKTSVKDYPIRSRLNNQQDKEERSGEPPLPAKLLTSTPQVVRPIVIKKEKGGFHTVKLKTVDKPVPAISTRQPHVVEHSDVGEEMEEQRAEQKEQGRATSPEEGSQVPERKAAKRQREPEGELTSSNIFEQAATWNTVQRGKLSESTNLTRKEIRKENSEQLHGPERRRDKRRGVPELITKLATSLKRVEVTSKSQVKPMSSVLERHTEDAMEVSSEELVESEEEGAVEVLNHSGSDYINHPRDALGSEDGRTVTQGPFQQEVSVSTNLTMKESSQKVLGTTRESSEGDLHGPGRRGDKRERDPEGRLTTNSVGQDELTSTFQTKRKASILEPLVVSGEKGPVEVLNQPDIVKDDHPQDTPASEDSQTTRQKVVQRVSESINRELKGSSQKIEKAMRQSSEGELQGPERRGDKRRRESEEDLATNATKRKRVGEVKTAVSEPGTFQSKPALEPHDSFKDVVEVSSEEMATPSKCEEDVDVVLYCSESNNNNNLHYTLASEDVHGRREEAASEWANLKIKENSQNARKTYEEELKGTSSDEYIDIVDSDENIDVLEETDVCLQCHTNLQDSPNRTRKASVPLHDSITKPPPEPLIPYSLLSKKVESGSGRRDGEEEEEDVDIIGWTSPLPVLSVKPPPEPQISHPPQAMKVHQGSKGSEQEDAENEEESEVDIIGWDSPLADLCFAKQLSEAPMSHLLPLVATKVDLESPVSDKEQNNEEEDDVDVMVEEEEMDVIGSQNIKCKGMLRKLMLSEREMDNVQIINLLSSPL